MCISGLPFWKVVECDGECGLVDRLGRVGASNPRFSVCRSRDILGIRKGPKVGDVLYLTSQTGTARPAQPGGANGLPGFDSLPLRDGF